MFIHLQNNCFIKELNYLKYALALFLIPFLKHSNILKFNKNNFFHESENPSKVQNSINRKYFI